MAGFRKCVNTLVIETLVDLRPESVALESIYEPLPSVTEHTKSAAVVAYGTETVVSYFGI